MHRNGYNLEVSWCENVDQELIPEPKRGVEEIHKVAKRSYSDQDQVLEVASSSSPTYHGCAESRATGVNGFSLSL